MGPVRDLVRAHGDGRGGGAAGHRGILSGEVVLTPDSVRPVSVEDLREALRRIRPSVSKESLAHFAEWERLNS